MAHVRVVKTEREAFAFVYSNFTPEDTILLENDLPDAFNS
jgi:UDP-N-acetylmuramoyl-tripeptide--D-alanyl-D-alanine ligase